MPSMFAPLSFRSGLVAKNSLVLAPLTNQQSHPDGTLADAEFDWLVSRADGGFGVVMTCASHVAKDGQGWAGELGIFDDAQLPGLTRLASALRQREAASIVQLFHGGSRANPQLTGTSLWSASEADGVRAATAQDLQRVVAQFADAAGRAQQAGMDGVELHGAHGYLFTQFLSTATNRREDAYGGTLENRARLLREALRAVRARVGARFTVGVRLSPENYGNLQGLDLDESLQVAAWLAEDGVDYVHLSLWDASRPTLKRPGEHAIPLFRAALPEGVRILVAGKVWTREDAESLLGLGADAVAIGRAAIGNPRWALLAREPDWEPARPPYPVETLRANHLSPAFAEYMRQWKGFVL